MAQLEKAQKSSPTEPYTVQTVTQQEKPAVLRFLREFFFETEPLNEYFMRNMHVRYRDRGTYPISVVSEGLSLMAVANSGQIIGISINGDVRGIHEGNSDEKNPIFPIMRKTMVYIDNCVDAVAKLEDPDQKEVEVRMIGVHPDWKRRGIAERMIRETCDLAKREGFNQIRAVCSSSYSARLFEKLGFQCVYSLAYKDYKVDGNVVFEPAPPHTHVRALILKID